MNQKPSPWMNTMTRLDRLSDQFLMCLCQDLSCQLILSLVHSNVATKMRSVLWPSAVASVFQTYRPVALSRLLLHAEMQVAVAICPSLMLLQPKIKLTLASITIWLKDGLRGGV